MKNKLRVCIVQHSISWENIDENLNHLSSLLSDISFENTDIVILPEMFATGFSMNPSGFAQDMDGTIIDWMRIFAKEKGVTIAGSIAIKVEEKYFNRFIWIHPDGSLEKYDKRHLFRMLNEDRVYTKGNKRVIINFFGWRIMPLICYDLRFPVWSRNNQEYELLIYIANWPESRSYAWKQLLIARAIENQCFVIGVNRIGKDANEMNHSGDSMIIGPRGEILVQLNSNMESITNFTIDNESLTVFLKSFPAYLDADRFEIVT